MGDGRRTSFTLRNSFNKIIYLIHKHFTRKTLVGGTWGRKCHWIASLEALSRHFQTSFHNDQLLPKKSIAHLQPIPVLAWLQLFLTAIELKIQFFSI